jgi:hypothetical protein
MTWHVSSSSYDMTCILLLIWLDMYPPPHMTLHRTCARVQTFESIKNKKVGGIRILARTSAATHIRQLLLYRQVNFFCTGFRLSSLGYGVFGGLGFRVKAHIHTCISPTSSVSTAVPTCTASVMMWQRVWWCDSDCDDVTVSVMMWQRVWWCDSECGHSSVSTADPTCTAPLLHVYVCTICMHT